MTLVEIAQTLGRIEAQGRATHDLVANHVDDDERVHTDLELRLRAQEKFRWVCVGAFLLVSSLGGYGLLS